MSEPTCDWCLRPEAPEGWEYDGTPEPDRYCWGPGDCLCDELHGEAWDRLTAEVARIRSELAAAREWRPIETAPKCVWVLIGGHSYDVGIGWQSPDGTWRCQLRSGRVNPTHWLPLPEPPQAGGDR